MWQIRHNSHFIDFVGEDNNDDVTHSAEHVGKLLSDDGGGLFLPTEGHFILSRELFLPTRGYFLLSKSLNILPTMGNFGSAVEHFLREVICDDVE